MTSNRRNFLRTAALCTPAAFVGTQTWNPAFAAEAEDYRALVCLFMFGGLDCHDTVIPYDLAAYQSYAEIRSELLQRYEFIGGGSTRLRERLLPIATTGQPEGTEYALPEELGGIKTLYDAGAAAIVANVGPLIEPVTRSALDSGAESPPRLFSHNDQQSTWLSFAPEGARFGWGGRFADALIAKGSNVAAEFTAITTRANRLFLTGASAQPYRVSTRGAPRLGLLQDNPLRGTPLAQQFATDAMRDHFGAVEIPESSLLISDYAAAMRRALRTNDDYDAALAASADLQTPFPNTGLGGQLRAVARTIAARKVLGARRQIFFVGIGGFDTHSSQAQQLPGLQRAVDGAVVAFHSAMRQLSLGEHVTLFTASDFGRTLSVNGDGTDHGWGGHQFVVGDAVAGGQVFGEFPSPTLGHAADAGSGRLIPTMAVEPFAASLGRWLGMSETELVAALPRLNRFADSDLSLFG